MAQILQRFVTLEAALRAYADEGRTVAEVLPALTDMMVAKRSTSSTVLRNDAGVITHIMCSYHKKYEPVAPLGTSDEDIEALGLVKYGRKAGSAHGYAHACAEGINQQSAAKRKARNDAADVTSRLLDGEIDREEAKDQLIDIELVSKIVVDRTDGAGHDSAEAAKASWDGADFA